MSKKRVEAVAYLRTPTNVGPDKDSDKRQRDAIHAFAKRAGYEIVDVTMPRSRAPTESKSARASRASSSASEGTGCARSSSRRPTG